VTAAELSRSARGGRLPTNMDEARGDDGRAMYMA